MRNLEELINLEDSAYPTLLEWKAEARNKIEVLAKDTERANEALYLTQVTTRSPMGAIIYETGGILINNGWLRILGSGNERLDRSLPDWNKGKAFKEYGEQPTFLLIADDILGGFFAINAGGISSEDIGMVFYFAPDTAQWESTNKGYSDFIYWCFVGDLDLYYKGFFWNGYEVDLKQISGNEAMSFFPFLWTKEGKDINKCTRKAVLISEVWKFNINNQAE